MRDYYSQVCAKDHKHHDHKHDTQHRHHCCGYNLIEHGVGYADLDELIKNPKALDFIFEVVRVEQPGEYKKDSWILTEEEQIAQIPILKEAGNALFKEKNYLEASKKYEEALGYLENLMLKEKPNDVEWNELNEKKIPILLNYSLCKFNLNEFYSCIEHCNTILETQTNNVKALFRRAKAYAAIWNLNNAKEDFKKCLELDSTLTNEVNKLLVQLDKSESLQNKKEADKYRGKLFA